MVQKRDSRDQGGDDFSGPRREFKKRSFFRTVVEGLTRGPSFNEALWESFFRRVVREEVERVVLPLLNASSSHSTHQAGPSSEGPSLELRFAGELPPTLYTGSKIGPEGPNSVLHIYLVDTSSQAIVRTGPLSSMKVEIVPLDGQFGSDDQENWTPKQFNDSVLIEREGRRPLITGDLTVVLENGVGVIGNVVFTDNSSWIRCRRFRLGARPISGEERVREARTRPFTVKDHRGELYKKHHPPMLDDEVWRLEKIAKDGAFHKRLAEYRVNFVKDFLQLYMTNQSVLRQMLGKISSRTWNTIAEHAKTCVVDDNKFYLYLNRERQVSIFFDSVYRVVRACISGQSYSPDQFNPSQKVLVDNLKQYVYRNMNELVPVDGFAGPEWPLLEPGPEPGPELINNSSQHYQLDYQTGHQDLQVQQICPCPATTLIGGPEVNQQVVVSSSQPINPHMAFPQAHRNSFSMEDFLQQNFNFELGSSSSQLPMHFNGESPLHFPWIDPEAAYYITAKADEPAEAGIFPLGIVQMSRDGKGKAQWCKIRAAIKCWLSYKDVASRKMSNRPFFLSC